MDKERMRRVRGGEIGMVFQEPMISLNPVLTVGKQIREVLRIHKGLLGSAAHDRALDLLQAVGIPDAKRVADGYPHQISGGMQQRAMIAMALAGDPRLLIADEPTTALDVTIEVQILNLILELQQQRDMALMMISHDLGIVAETTDRVAVMYAGRVVEFTETTTLFHEPRHPYTLGLMASIPGSKQSRVLRKAPLETIPGTVPKVSALPPGCKFSSRCSRAFETCANKEPELKTHGSDQHLVRCFLYEN
jgi:oligopeptide/dipeptide ABC transporter ATP-binding protein